MQKMFPAALAVGLAMCANVPASLRPASAGELAARDAMIEAWAAAGRAPVDCTKLSRLDVAEMPQSDVAAWCARPEGSPIQACTFGINLTVFSPVSTAIYVIEGVDARTHASLIAHEVGHQLSSCAGRGLDHEHSDTELWTTIERDAVRRWEARQP